VIIILILGGATAVWKARQSVEKEVQSSITLALNMIEFGFSQLPVSNRYGSNWLHQISALQQTRHLNISIEEQGKEPIELLPRAQKSEDDERIPQWFINAVMTDYLTAHYDVLMADGSMKRIVITADPLDEISEAWGESQAFFISILLMSLVIFLAINLVFHSVFQTVQKILGALKRVESGDFQNVLPESNISELDQITREINTMSAALNKAQKENQELAKHTIQIQEAERKNLSKELHDEMGQSLTAIKAMAVAVKQPNTDSDVAANSIIEICNHLALVVRSMMRTLHPLSLADLGLHATLSDMVSEWQRRDPELTINLNCVQRIDALDNKIAIHVYRIVQECLTNIVRHAKASKVTINVQVNKRVAAEMVNITVIDNGVGSSTNTKGFGVLGMRERVESLGGAFSFSSKRGNGVTVKATIPFVEKEHD
jgi:two-component system sensor histidine kinase UhpB